MGYKLVKYLVALCFIFSVYSFLYVPVHAESDLTPPRVTSITMDKTVAHVGDTVTYSVSVVEDGTGMSDLPRLSIYGPDYCRFELPENAVHDPTKEYYTGTYQLQVTITKDMAPGDYVIREIYVNDYAGNCNRYIGGYDGSIEQNEFKACYANADRKEDEPSLFLPGNLTLTIINDEYSINIANIKSVELKEHDISYNSTTIPVDVLFEGEIPDEFFFRIRFDMDYDYNKGYISAFGYLKKADLAHDGMLYHLNLGRGANFDTAKSGSYHIVEIDFEDNNNASVKNPYSRLFFSGYDELPDFTGLVNQRQYQKEGISILEHIEDYSVKVIGDDAINFTENYNADKEPPVLSNVKVSDTKVSQSGVITIDLTITDNEAIHYVDACIVGNEGCPRFVTDGWYGAKEWTGRITIKIPPTAHIGKYQLSLYTCDTSMNYAGQQFDIEITEEFEKAFDIGNTHPELYSKIHDLKDGESGFIQVRTQNFTVKKEIFEAIKGRDVNIVFYQENYSWIFNGLNVTNPKDIQIGVEINTIDTYLFDVPSNTGFYYTYVTVEFPDNGELPGKSEVRIQSDCLRSMWNKNQALYLYFKKANGEYELQDTNVEYFDDANTPWCYFDITHNSTYCVSGDMLNKYRAKNTDQEAGIIKSKKIKITGLSHKIAAGKKIKLVATVLPENASNKSVTWTSSNPKVATVDKTGKVTVKKKTGGKSVTITATAKDGSGVKGSWAIKSMKGVVKSVKIKGAKPVKAGKKLKLKSTVKATKGANKTLKWTSNNKKWATVNSKGMVTTKKAGKGKTVKITAMATDGSGKKKTVKIKIK